VHQTEFKPSVSIVIPCYNEETRYLVQCIESVCKAEYPNKEVIVVDDGSTNKEVWKTIKQFQQKYSFQAFQFEKNKGKRNAMTHGFKKASGDIVITMDSDSVIPDGTSIEKLVQPFINEDVGAVSGCVLVKNRNNSLMTKIQDARYWLAFFIEKSSQNPYNSVTCASGPFSAYRREYLMKFLDDWQNQVFLGQSCTYGDDRGLTTFMLKEGYNVKFARDAIAYTNVPENLRKFVKQQIRWKKSFLRENWYLLGFIGNRNALMVMEFVLFWTVLILGFIAKIITLAYLVIHPYTIANFLLAILFVAFLHYIYAFIKSPGKRGYFGLMYGFLNEFLIVWLLFWAWFKLKDTSWGTR
jgi:hyaluronan synthase/N-acetylglucosaminyltransferase